MSLVHVFTFRLFQLVYLFRLKFKMMKVLGVKTIRIINGCEVRIEKSVSSVTVRHHEACRTVTVSRVTEFFYSNRTIIFGAIFI